MATKPLTEAQREQYRKLSEQNRGVNNPNWKDGVSLGGWQSEYQRKHKRESGQRYREFVKRLKTKPCTDCGNSFPPCAMDFDHRDPSLKTAEVSKLLRFRPRKEVILKEVAKCDVVCANCHRIRTWKRQIEINQRRAYFERVRVD